MGKLVNIDKSKLQKPPSPLVSKKDRSKKFKISIDHKPENNYCFKCLTKSSKYRKFYGFLKKTIYRNLSISEVDELYRRQDDKNDKVKINGVEYEIIHYGEKKKSFRLHGYYNSYGYFVIYRIDPDHKYHRN